MKVHATAFRLLQDAIEDATRRNEGIPIRLDGPVDSVTIEPEHLCNALVFVKHMVDVNAAQRSFAEWEFTVESGQMGASALDRGVAAADGQDAVCGFRMNLATGRGDQAFLCGLTP